MQYVNHSYRFITALFSFAVLGTLLVCLCSCGTSPIAGQWTQAADDGEKTLTISDTLDSWELVFPDGHKASGSLEFFDEGDNLAYMVMHNDSSTNYPSAPGLEDQLWYDGTVLYYRRLDLQNNDKPSEWNTMIDMARARESRMGLGDSVGSNSPFAGLWNKRSSL